MNKIDSFKLGLKDQIINRKTQKPDDDQDEEENERENVESKDQ